MNTPALFELRNPHSILQAIHKRPDAVREVRINGRHPHGIWEKVIEAAGNRGIAMTSQRTVSRDQSNNRRGKSTERQGGGMAMIAPPQPADLAKLLAAPKNGDILIALDCLQDPQNVGAVFRSAAFFGTRGVITTKDKSAPINGTVCDVAAGGLDSIPFHIATNLVRVLEQARDAGYWILGTSEHAQQSAFDIDDRPWVVVIGSEQSGMRRLTQDNCDEVCRMEPKGSVKSLNAAAATASVLTAMTRPRG